jgi:adenylate kinase family enzyme
MKAVIIGNSGSGKTWLATRLSGLVQSKVIHLDELFWESGGFDRKRNPEDVLRRVAQSKERSSWIVEGVFGELAEHFLSDAGLLIWLDIEWTRCEVRLLARGSESKAHMDRAQSQAGISKLAQWASTYQTREDSRSYSGHERLFQSFQGTRYRLRSEEEVLQFLGEAQRFVPADRQKVAPFASAELRPRSLP